jgi:hypothetical protein
VILTSVETAFKHMQIEAQAPQRLK